MEEPSSCPHWSIPVRTFLSTHVCEAMRGDTPKVRVFHMNESPGGLATGLSHSNERQAADLAMPPKKSRPCRYLQFSHPNAPSSTYSAQEASLSEPRQVVVVLRFPVQFIQRTASPRKRSEEGRMPRASVVPCTCQQVHDTATLHKFQGLSPSHPASSALLLVPGYLPPLLAFLHPVHMFQKTL